MEKQIQHYHFKSKTLDGCAAKFTVCSYSTGAVWIIKRVVSKSNLDDVAGVILIRKMPCYLVYEERLLIKVESLVTIAREAAELFTRNPLTA